LEQYGIDLSINGNSWGTLIKCYDGTGPGITDIPLVPGEYDIVGTVSGNSGCDNFGEKFNFHITLSNPACDPGYFTYEVQQPPGYKCNGSINKIIYHSTNCVESNYVDIFLVNPDGSERFIDHYNPNGDNVSVLPGTYGLKAVVNNECSTTIGGITIEESSCPTLTLTYDPLEEVGFNCPTSINNISVTANPGACLGTNYFDKYVYDENMNQIGFAHQDGIFNVAVTSGHTYYMQAFLNGECKSDLVTVAVPPFSCTGTLTEVSRKDSAAGILCPNANMLELKYTANACYSTWYLEESNSQLVGENGSWSASKDETIKVSLVELRKNSDKYRFIAHLDNATCVATYKPSGFNNKGCDGKITSRLIRPESSPGAHDAVYGFSITTSACTDLYGDPWVITLKNTKTGESAGTTGYYRRTTIGGLTAGTYRVSFGDHAGICTYKNAQTITIPVASSINVIPQDSLAALNSLSSSNVSEDNLKAGNNKEFDIALTPNPAQNATTLSITGGEWSVDISLRDASGKTLWKKEKITDKKIIIPLQNFSNGIYFVTVSDRKHHITRKLVKVR
jgi:hypothetical protein